jgi:hypothetical protein
MGKKRGRNSQMTIRKFGDKEGSNKFVAEWMEHFVEGNMQRREKCRRGRTEEGRKGGRDDSKGGRKGGRKEGRHRNEYSN